MKKIDLQISGGDTRTLALQNVRVKKVWEWSGKKWVRSQRKVTEKAVSQPSRAVSILLLLTSGIATGIRTAVANPLKEVSLYFVCMSLAVTFMAEIASSNETACWPVPEARASWAETTALTAPRAFLSIQGACTRPAIGSQVSLRRRRGEEEWDWERKIEAVRLRVTRLWARSRQPKPLVNLPQVVCEWKRKKIKKMHISHFRNCRTRRVLSNLLVYSRSIPISAAFSITSGLAPIQAAKAAALMEQATPTSAIQPPWKRKVNEKRKGKRPLSLSKDRTWNFWECWLTFGRWNCSSTLVKHTNCTFEDRKQKKDDIISSSLSSSRLLQTFVTLTSGQEKGLNVSIRIFAYELQNVLQYSWYNSSSSVSRSGHDSTSSSVLFIDSNGVGAQEIHRWEDSSEEKRMRTKNMRETSVNAKLWHFNRRIPSRSSLTFVEELAWLDGWSFHELLEDHSWRLEQKSYLILSSFLISEER